ncbi:hypothetical protein V1517DRAFT_325360 [Lipomyces orientalis]|uniref:Uncharacterized protein n=1 Tax=Lipomyces orientalis TaxID=1233043 RepID=A0ACC3TLP6_9ASCO
MQAAVALPYRLYFLYFEPFFALSGAYLPIFRSEFYLSITVPHSILYPTPNSPSPSTQPLTGLLLTQISILYAFFSFNEAVVLRCTDDLRVWRALLSGCLLSDFGHLYANLIVADPTIFWNPWSWGVDEWGNLGILWAGAILRVAFLWGVGVDTNNLKQKYERKK